VQFGIVPVSEGALLSVMLSFMARHEARFAWWAAIAALAGCAVYMGTWRMWSLTVLTWSLYELCLCPTTCGVATRGGRPCHRAARGRLFACAEVAGHQALKTEAFWRVNGARIRATYGRGPAHRKEALAPSPAEHGSVEARHRLLAYVAIISTVATIVQTAVGLATL
jgi:hypothetical protein